MYGEGRGEGVLVSRLSDRVLQAPDDVSKQIVLKIKSIVIKYVIIHILSGDLLSLYENVIFWRFFIIFNISNVFVP